MEKSSLFNGGLLLAGILFLALALRLWGIDFGLPYLFHPDEGFEVNRALQLGTGSFNFDRTGKGGYFYLLFIEYGVFFVVGYILGMFSNAKDFAELYIADPTYFYLIGRVTSALIGTTTVYFLYKLISRITLPQIGLLAAALLAVNPLHTIQSHYIVVDVPLVFLTVYAFYLLSKLTINSSTKLYLFIGAVIAAATVTKMPGILLVFPFVVIHLYLTYTNQQSFLSSLFDKKLLLSGICFIVVFAIGNPGAIINFSDYIQQFKDILFSPSMPADPLSLSENKLPDIEVADVGDGTDRNKFIFYLSSTEFAITSIGVALALLGVIFAVKERQIQLINIFAFSVLFYVAICLASTQELVFLRYVLPYVPLCLGLVAYAIFKMYSLIQIRSNQVVAKTSLAILIAAVSIQPAYTSVQQNVAFTLPDTRELAADWFHKNVPENTSVMLEGFSGRSYTFTAPLRPSKNQLSEIIKEFTDIGQKGKAYYFNIDRNLPNIKRYDLTFFNFNTVPTIDYVLQNGISYLIIRPNTLIKNNEAKAQELFEGLEVNFQLIKRFEPEKSKFTGPDLYVYKLSKLEVGRVPYNK